MEDRQEEKSNEKAQQRVVAALSEAGVGFEPTNDGFANRCLRPLGYPAFFCVVAGQSLHEYGRSVKIKNEFLLLLFSGCRVVTALDTTPRALYHVLI